MNYDSLANDASMDQGTKAIANFATMIAVYFRQLQLEGFTREEAFEMALAYQDSMTRNRDSS